MKRHENIHLLLVEDDDVDAMSIKRGFKKRGICSPITRARDGVEALEFIRSCKIRRPFVIMLDLEMPRMGGIEFLKELRQDPDFSDLVVFVLTTSSDEKDMVDAYRLNIAGYMVKDSVEEEFLKVVHMLNSYWETVRMPSSASFE